MKIKKPRLFSAIVFILCCVYISMFAVWAYQSGYRINLSPSVPTGIWKIVSRRYDVDSPDEYAVVSASEHFGYRLAMERGYLSDFTPMLKRAAATEADVIDYDEKEKAVTVNGAYLFATEIFSKDTEGQVLPRPFFPMLLRREEVWLSSENIRGYDSRYFGPVSQDVLQGAVLIWKFCAL
jgi:conjugative transfer signal peptidase TraF